MLKRALQTRQSLALPPRLVATFGAFAPRIPWANALVRSSQACKPDTHSFAAMPEATKQWGLGPPLPDEWL